MLWCFEVCIFDARFCSVHKRLNLNSKKIDTFKTLQIRSFPQQSLQMLQGECLSVRDLLLRQLREEALQVFENSEFLTVPPRPSFCTVSFALCWDSISSNSPLSLSRSHCNAILICALTSPSLSWFQIGYLALQQSIHQVPDYFLFPNFPDFGERLTLSTSSLVLTNSFWTMKSYHSIYATPGLSFFSFRSLVSHSFPVFQHRRSYRQSSSPNIPALLSEIDHMPPIDQSRRRSTNPNFWVRISSGGVGVFHMKGWGPKNSVCPRNQRKQIFWRDISGFCRDVLGVPEKFEKKCVQFLAPNSVYFAIASISPAMGSGFPTHKFPLWTNFCTPLNSWRIASATF